MRKSGNKKTRISMNKRLMSVCLSLTMVVGSFSVFAFADEIDAEEPEAAEQAVVEQVPAEAEPAVAEETVPAEVETPADEELPADAEVPADAEQAEDAAAEEEPAEIQDETASEDTPVEVPETVTDQVTVSVNPAMADSEETLTVCDGTSTNPRVPVFGYNTDVYQRCHLVFPASMLADMNDSTISSMKFHSSTTAVNWGSPKFDIYLTEVDSSSISAFADVSKATKVYSGTLTVSSSSMVVNFTQEYEYNGGNLLVCIDTNTRSNRTAECSFFGVPSNGSCVSGFSGNSIGRVTPYQRSFLPKTTFGYTPAAAAVKTAPEANELTYDGEDQELVTAGVGIKTMEYALGTSATSAPTSGWSEDIPTGVDAGTYYVWYKAVGSTEGDETEPACVEVTIEKADLNPESMVWPTICEDRTEHGELILKGDSLTIISGGSVDGGEVKFSLEGSEYSTSPVVVTEPGEYHVGLKIFGDKNHNDLYFGTGTFYVMNYEFVSGADATWDKNQDTSKNLVFTIKRSRLDDQTYGNVEKVYVDGEELNDSSYNLEEGSAIITLSADYLKTLAEGKHTFRVDFSDPYTVETSLTITAAPASPQTGEGASALVIALSGILAAAGAAFVIKAKRA